MSESNTTYNGWTNYPTWAVNLWLSNDEGLYRQTQGRIAGHVKYGRSKYEVVENLKEWVTNELAPDLGATFAADLLGYALDLVDWDAIAAYWLADVEVEA